MNVGCATADITPAPGGHLSGYVARQQPSVGIHDPLTAQALYVEDGAARLLWLHADVIGYERADVLRLKEDVRRGSGLPSESVIVTATHTHSGPPTMWLLGCGDYDAVYVERLHTTFLDLAGQAMRAAEPAELVFTEGTCGLGVDRRGGTCAHTDPRLPVLAWKRLNGTFAAVLAVYAMHNVAMGPANRSVSADVAGEAARRLSERLPGTPPVLFVNGACGNINPPSVGDDFARVAAWGQELAAEAASALAGALPLPGATLRLKNGTCGNLAPYPVVEPEAAARAWAENQTAGASGPMRDKTFAVAREWAERLRSPEPAVQARNAAPVDVQAVMFGDARLVGVGAEVFSVLNDDIRRRTGHGVYVVGYANGDAGYICPDSAFDEGGYEPDDAYHYYGTRPIARGSHDAACAAAAACLEGVSP